MIFGVAHLIQTADILSLFADVSYTAYTHIYRCLRLICDNKLRNDQVVLVQTEKTDVPLILIF